MLPKCVFAYVEGNFSLRRMRYICVLRRVGSVRQSNTNIPRESVFNRIAVNYQRKCPFLLTEVGNFSNSLYWPLQDYERTEDPGLVTTSVMPPLFRHVHTCGLYRNLSIFYELWGEGAFCRKRTFLTCGRAYCMYSILSFISDQCSYHLVRKRMALLEMYWFIVILLVFK